MKPASFKNQWKSLLVLQGIVMLYSLAGAAGKFASFYSFLSPGFIFFYGLEIVILGVYALVWQQIIKRFDLSQAYANRAMAMVWSLCWAVLFFHENITFFNICGVLITIAGIWLINTEPESSRHENDVFCEEKGDRK